MEIPDFSWGGGGENPGLGSMGQLVQQLWRAGKQRRRLFTRRAVIYSRARYIFVVKTVADDLEYVFSRGNARPIPFNIPRSSTRPFARDSRRIERALRVLRDMINHGAGRTVRD